MIQPSYIRPRFLTASLLVSALALGACSRMPMMSATTAMSASLTGASEVPAVGGDGAGTVEATLDKGSMLLTWTVTYSGLSGPATAAHFHGPAMAGKNAGVVVPVKGSLASPISGSATLTPAQVDDLTAGRWYFNLHTAANPGGEIRGQVASRP